MHHVVHPATYYKVFAWLMILLVVTVAAARIDLGSANVPLALAIATLKAVLIVLFFMHVRHGSPLVRLFAFSGFFWLLILLVIVLTDVRARSLGW